MKHSNYEMQLAIMISDIHRNWREAIDSIAKTYNVTRTGWHVIGKLCCRGPQLSQAELCQQLGINNAQLTRTLNQLEEKDMITRITDKTNRRSNFVALKNPKAQYIKDIKQVNIKINKLISNKLTASESKQAIHILEKIYLATENIENKL